MGFEGKEGRQADLLLLTAGEFERGALQQGLDATEAGAMAHPVLQIRDAKLARAEGELVEDGRVEEHAIRILKQQHHLAAEATVKGAKTRPLMTLSRVVLPEPLLPSRTSRSPAAMAKLRSVRACSPSSTWCDRPSKRMSGVSGLIPAATSGWGDSSGRVIEESSRTHGLGGLGGIAQGLFDEEGTTGGTVAVEIA